MKRLSALMLVLILLAGCTVLSAAPDNGSTPLLTDAPQTAAPGADGTTDPQITADQELPSISWSAAFRTRCDKTAAATVTTTPANVTRTDMNRIPGWFIPRSP